MEAARLYPELADSRGGGWMEREREGLVANSKRLGSMRDTVTQTEIRHGRGRGRGRGTGRVGQTGPETGGRGRGMGLYRSC